MSEAVISIVISVVILGALALFVPCAESVVGICRRGSRKKETAAQGQRFPSQDV